MRVLVTGGGGFIGSHLTDELIEQGHEVTIFDNFTPQVHKTEPKYLNQNAKLIKGDMNNPEELYSALKDVDAVFNYAAAVGIGQSMYEIAKYTKENMLGTAQLMDLLVNKETSVKKVIVASSMSIYGEGPYKCPECGSLDPKERSIEQMKENDWEMRCSSCNAHMDPTPTTEKHPTIPSSVYALSKKMQEDLTLQLGKTYGIPSTALRFFNVYGTRQALSNPYTGVAAIFMSSIKNGNAPLIFEDGLQTRDFISVKDIVQGSVLALNNNSANYDFFNLGSGTAIPIKGVAERLISLMNSKITPDIPNQFRSGDVRHCFSDISKAKDRLGFDPKVSFDQSLKELILWSGYQESEDKVGDAKQELKDRNLVHS